MIHLALEKRKTKSSGKSRREKVKQGEKGKGVAEKGKPRVRERKL